VHLLVIVQRRWNHGVLSARSALRPFSPERIGCYRIAAMAMATTSSIDR